MTTPSAVAAQRLSPLTPLVRAPILVLAVAGGSWQQMVSGDSIGILGIILLLLLVVGGIYGTVSWLLTKYWVAGDELRIDTGVLFRQSRRIRIDRLQGVDIVQPLVARFFGLAELRFDTAGGDREGSLAFLRHTRALELRRLLLDRRDDLREPEPGAEPGEAAPGPDGARPEPQERVLLTLALPRLVGSLALSSQTLWLTAAAVALGVSFALTGSFAAAGGLVPALVGLGVALGRRLTSYYGFVLSESAAGLQVRRGLASLSSQTIAVGRIQGLAVMEPVLWRRFGWARLDVSVAGYQRTDPDAVQASSTLMPVAPREEILGLVRHVLGQDVTLVPMVRAPRRAAWLAPLAARNFALGQDDHFVVSRRGFWTRRLEIVPHRRAQSVRVTQGPLQRRLGLADVHVDSPPGVVHAVGRQRDAGDAVSSLQQLVVHGRRARNAPRTGLGSDVSGHTAARADDPSPSIYPGHVSHTVRYPSRTGTKGNDHDPSGHPG